MEETQKSPVPKYLIIGAAVVLGLVGLFFLINNRTNAEPASISGQIDYNGIKPTKDTNTKDVKVIIKARPNTEGSSYETLNINIPLTDNAPWKWDEAVAGTTYSMYAEVTYKGTSVKKSNSVVTTAPAQGIVFVFNITNADIAKVRPDLVPDTDTTTPETATVSGTITVNGFIPSGSTINVYGRKAGTTGDFQEAITALPAAAKVSFSYDKAISGETYEYQAELYDSNNTFIGQSNYLTVTAPASNEVVSINSTATAPSQKAKISGSIRLNGNVEQNSTILLLQRKAGTSDYQQINRYPANKTTSFTWNDAVAGTTYDITAALQVNETNTATGNVVTVAAPAGNVNITIDTNFNLSAPSQTPTVSCGNPDGTNHFNARVGVPQQNGAAKYYLQVGTSAGASNTFNGTLQPNDSTVIYIPADSPYFARYAFTACTDCQINDPSNWSGWSPTLGFKCPQ